MKRAITLNRRKFHTSIKLLLFVLSIIFSLLVGEFILALLGLEPYIKKSPKLSSLKGLTVNSFEEMINNGLVEGKYGKLRPDNELGYTQYSGPHGFKDQKNFYDDWSSYKRVLMLGDSFTEGAGAEKGRGFVDLLNNYYQKQGVIFFNTGIGGYGQNNQLAVLKKYFDVIKPHIVILCFYTNDFYDNLTPLDRYTAFPGCWIQNYEIIFREKNRPPKIRRRSPNEVFMLYQIYMDTGIHPKNYSFITYLKYKFFYKSRLGTLAWLGLDKIKSMSIYFRTDYKKNRVKKQCGYNNNYDYSITKTYLLKINEYLLQRNTPLHVFMIPDRFKSTVKLEKSRDYCRAISLFQELSIPYLDPFDYLRLTDYHKEAVNDHWNNSGHFKAYELLKNYINEILKEALS